VLKEHPDQVRHPLAELTLLTDGDTVFRLTDDWKAMEDILRRGQLVSSLAIKPLYDFVRERLAKQVKKSRTMVEVVDKKYRVLIEPDLVDGGFIAECPALPGCVTDGETKEEALRNMRDAIADWHSAGKEKRLAKAE
jgi:predicted RNase H-like HicB family nuclease